MDIIKKIFGGKKRDTINRNAQAQLDEYEQIEEERRKREAERAKNRKNNSGHGSYHK